MWRTSLRIIALIFVAVFWAPSHALSDDTCGDVLPKVLRGSVTLPSGCIFIKPVRITESNTTLNCNGSVFDGVFKHKNGLFIDSKGKPLSNIKVENCTFRNFRSSGIRIAWSEVDSRKGTDRNEIYSRTPSEVIMRNIAVERCGGVGIFIDDYVSGVTLRDSVIRDCGGVGLYLEHSSRNNRILNCRIVRNGFGSESKPHAREGVAVDSSAGNLIEGNLFEGNRAGGIFLYKNCGERIKEGKSVIRWQPSERNEIRNNRFIGERVGIWIAARQSRDISHMGCGDPPMDSSRRYYEDFANRNVVENNWFCRNKVAIRVEGDENRILTNRFDKAAGKSVEIPVTKREQILKRPPRGNIISGNEVAECFDHTDRLQER